MSSLMTSVLDAERRADIARWDDMQRKGVNLEAIVELREGAVGEELAEFWIASARREAAAILPGLPATEQRLRARIGALESHLRDACEMLERAVQPVEAMS
jgi:hypothetical protein